MIDELEASTGEFYPPLLGTQFSIYVPMTMKLLDTEYLKREGWVTKCLQKKFIRKNLLFLNQVFIKATGVGT